MANGNGLTAKEVIEAIREKRGNLTSVARDLKCSRMTVYRFMEKHQTVKDALEESRESMIDNVESKLYSKALEGEGWAVCFFLKTQGKHRGYTERQEISGPDGGQVEFVVTYENTHQD